MVLKLEFHLKNHACVWVFLNLIERQHNFSNFDSFTYALRERINYGKRKAH